MTGLLFGAPRKDASAHIPIARIRRIVAHPVACPECAIGIPPIRPDRVQHG
jgi:hypothetical protein